MRGGAPCALAVVLMGLVAAFLWYGSTSRNTSWWSAAAAVQQSSGRDDTGGMEGVVTATTTTGTTATAVATTRSDGGGGSLFCSPITVPLASRVSFPQYALKLRDYVDAHVKDPARRQRPFRAVEIGSLYCGNVFSFRTVLKMFAPPDLKIEYYAVDSWGYRGDEPGQPDHNDEARGLRLYQYCQDMLNLSFPDTTLVRRKSVDGAAQFEDSFFDLVYIDALHTYDAAKSDMKAWWPKLRDGGLFAGDDYGDERIAHLYPWTAQLYRNFRWGVIQAVEEFATLHKVPVHVTHHEHKMHPKLLAMVPTNISLPEKKRVFMGSYRGVPNWYLVKPHPQFDGTCAEVILKDGWIRELD